MLKLDIMLRIRRKCLTENSQYSTQIDRVAKGDIRLKIRDILGAFMFGGEASDKKLKCFLEVSDPDWL